MLSNALRSLVHASGVKSKLWSAYGLGSLVAISIPILALVLGSIIRLLIPVGSTVAGSNIAVSSTAPAEEAVAGEAEAGILARQVSPRLPDLLGGLASDAAPLAQVLYLLLIGLGLALLVCFALWIYYRQLQSAAVAFEVSMISALRGHAKRLATVRTLSAQRQALTDCLTYHLPRVRASLARWWRTFPRHLIQLVVSLLVAFLIQPQLALLTLIATGLAILIYRFLDSRRRTTLPVVRERAAQERGGLMSLCLDGPLLESIHDHQEIDSRFRQQLEHYRVDAFRSLTSSSWKTPVVLFAAACLMALFAFLFAVQILRENDAFTLASAVTFTLVFLAAATSLIRLQKSYRELSTVGSAADELNRFLELPVEQFAAEELQAVERVTRSIELDHVTLQDSNGRKLLQNVSVQLQPGLMIGIVASQAIQARTLVELLMGFGRPVSGRLLFDDLPVGDLAPEQLSRCGHWVAGDGSIVTATVRENLLRGQADRADRLDEVVLQTKLNDAVQNLPDGLNTLITPDDDRFRGDAAFRIGLARALLANASIYVVEEPSGHSLPESEQETLNAIRQLVRPQSFTVVLPERLLTLRQCDVVVMLNDHQVVDVGTHAELLQRSELYRHLNYLRFNPFRNAANG